MGAELGHGKLARRFRVRVARRGAEYFCAKARQVPPGHRGGDHFDRATGQAETQRPDRVLAAPIGELLQGRREDALFAQFTSQSFVHGKNWSNGVMEFWS